MRYSILHFVIVFVSVSMTSVASARTWIVDENGGGDFTEIQSAIDAADEGDVVLVLPGNYLGFSLDKGVMVKAAGERFFVNGPVTIQAIEMGRTGGLSGAILETDDVLNEDIGYLEVLDSAGEVVIEDVRVALLSVNFLSSEGQRVSVVNCQNVSITNLVAINSREYFVYDQSASAVLIENSVVHMTDLVAQGLSGSFTTEGWPGMTGVEVRSSHVVIDSPHITGGQGAETGDEGSAGWGGSGILSENSDVLLMGNQGDFVRGGDGGNASYACFGIPGGGGDGFRGHSGLVSRVLLAGGIGGECQDLGQGAPNGDPYNGTVNFDHRFAQLTMDGSLHPGSSFVACLKPVEPGLALLLFSENGKRTDVGQVGPEFALCPDGYFFGFSLGQVNSRDSIEVPLSLIDDPILQGFVLRAQSAVIADSGEVFLTNAVVRVIGQ